MQITDRHSCPPPCSPAADIPACPDRMHILCWFTFYRQPNRRGNLSQPVARARQFANTEQQPARGRRTRFIFEISSFRYWEVTIKSLSKATKAQAILIRKPRRSWLRRRSERQLPLPSPRAAITSSQLTREETLFARLGVGTGPPVRVGLFIVGIPRQHDVM
jgi:hypothetical protein